MIDTCALHQKMGLFPMLRRTRSFEGPHMTCLQTQETVVARFSGRVDRYNLVLHKSVIFNHLRFLVYFSCGLLCMWFFIVMVIIFVIGFISINLFLRFQYKLTIVLLLMGRHRINFDWYNKVFIYMLHIVMLFIGGFGWIFMLFIET